MPGNNEVDSTETPLLFADEQCALDCLKCWQQNNQKRQWSKTLQTWRIMLDKYLEAPTLLDPCLERLVATLTDTAGQVWKQQPPHTTTKGRPLHVLSALCHLAKVRGAKTVQRFLPHEVHLVETVWQALHTIEQAADDDDDDATHTDGDSPPMWESQVMLWHWMHVFSLVPFDTTVFFAAVPELLALAQQRLSNAGPVRDAAAACLAAWLGRSDLALARHQFVQTALQHVADYRNCHHINLLVLLGLAQTCVTLWKRAADRATVMREVDAYWTLWTELQGCRSNGKSTHLQRYLVKGWTRLACLILPARVAGWRYQRGQRTLGGANLCGDDKVAANQAATKEETATPPLHQMGNGDSQQYVEPRSLGNPNDCIEHESEDDLFDVPERIEDVVGELLEALGNASTLVRWSVAKGLGRVTERLPACCADDILDELLSCRRLGDGIVGECDAFHHETWHGTCLALAELAFRGLLLPTRLKEVLNILMRAVRYDVPRRTAGGAGGGGSVGAHIRDAACYCYWALSRAYQPQVLQNFMSKMNEAIVLTSLFDREVNCRRAASAAFQEAVGRQGSQAFPNGITILTTADYFSVGSRTDAYTSIAMRIAALDEYKRPILEYLATDRLFHWDPTIRRLAAESFGLLTHLDVDTVATKLIPPLLCHCLDPKRLHVRHGAILGVAECLLALSKLGFVNSMLSKCSVKALVDLTPQIEQRRLYRGRGGEMVRQAVCRLVECVSLAGVEGLSVAIQVKHLDSVDACIPHPSEEVSEAACRAVGALLATYFPVGPQGPSDRLQKRVVGKFTGVVNDANSPAATRGYGLALGYLPTKLIAPDQITLDTVVAALAGAAKPDAVVGGEADAETRRNAVISAGRLGVSLARFPINDEGVVVPALRGLLAILLLAMEDYGADRRGEVGSWSRMAGINGATDVVLSTMTAAWRARPGLDDELFMKTMAAILKQLSERLDAVRKKAASALKRLCRQEHCTIEPLWRASVRDIVDEHPELFDELDISYAFHVAARCANVQCEDGTRPFLARVSQGLLLTIGGVDDSASKPALRTWLHLLQKLPSSAGSHEMEPITLDLLYDKSSRIKKSVISAVDKLLQHAKFVDWFLTAPQLQHAVLATLQSEISSSSDVQRLLIVANVATGMGLLAKPTNLPVDGNDQEGTTHTTSVRLLFRLLGHTYPRVRYHAAQQLFVLLQSRKQDENRVLTTIMSTPWGTDMAPAKAALLATDLCDEVLARRTTSRSY